MYRGVLVVLMFAVHAYRLEPGQTSTSLIERALAGLAWIEPLVAAAFLFVVGASLVLSREHAAGRGHAWLAHLSRRAAWLYGLSVLLFVAQYGVEFPDLLVSSGILSAIALAIVLVGACLLAQRSVLLLSIASLAIVAITATCDALHVTVSGIDGGPGAPFPLLAFSCWGALAAIVYRRRSLGALGIATATAVLPSALAAASRLAWTTTQTSHYVVHEREVALLELWKRGPVQPMLFWNHSAVGAVGLLFPLVGTLWLAFAVGPALEKARWSFPLELVGRHALLAYVMHLGVLGVIDLGDLHPPDARWTWGIVGALFACALVLAAALERRSCARAAHSSESDARYTARM